MNKQIAEVKLQHKISEAIRDYCKEISYETHPREWLKMSLEARIDGKRRTIETRDIELTISGYEPKDSKK